MWPPRLSRMQAADGSTAISYILKVMDERHRRRLTNQYRYCENDDEKELLQLSLLLKSPRGYNLQQR